MVTASFTIRLPRQFNFKSTVFSHGWCSLSPFEVRENPLVITRDIQIGRRSLARAEVRQGKSGQLSGQLLSISNLQPSSIERATQRITSMLHTGLDLKPFYERIKTIRRFSWAEQVGAGRMLRGDTFFEDAVKTILTTNCSWSLTTSMNQNLIEHFGASNSAGITAFPLPEAIADSSIAYLRKECRLGYRADYVYELSQRIAGGDLDIEAFRTSNAPAEELFRELTAIKGIGAYAAANLMRMLGKFDYLGLDSWCRNKIAELYGNGTVLPDREIESIYAPYAEWKGLAMWLDVTRHWYRDKFPLS